MAFDLSALSAWTQENAGTLYAKSVLTGKTASQMNHLTGLRGATKIPLLSTSTGLIKPSSCTLSASGDIIINQRTIAVEKAQIFMTFCVEDLDAYFTRQYLTGSSNYDGLGMAESQFIDQIVKQIQADMENGIWNYTIAGTNPFDGLAATIAIDKASTAIPAPQALSGAVTATNALPTVNAVRNAVPANLLDHIDNGEYILLMSHAAKRQYELDYQTTYGSLPYNTEFNKDFINGTNIKMIAVSGLTGNKMLMVNKNHLWMGTNIEGEETSITLSKGTGSEQNKLFLYGTFYAGVNYAFPSEIVVNGF